MRHELQQRDADAQNTIQRTIQRHQARRRTARARRRTAKALRVGTAALVAAASVAVVTQADAIPGATHVKRHDCRPQHLHDCVRAVNYWKRMAREARAAVVWQHHARMRLMTLRATRAAMGNVANWVCIHQHEGAWNDTGDPYWGGLQMDKGFMATYGSDMIRRHGGGLADTWTPAEQMVVAQRAYRTRGYHPWPNTARACGLL
jgi:hypothetical protein